MEQTLTFNMNVLIDLIQTLVYLGPLGVVIWRLSATKQQFETLVKDVDALHDKMRNQDDKIATRLSHIEELLTEVKIMAVKNAEHLKVVGS